jgi:tungstate transport system ATP-binding protein
MRDAVLKARDLVKSYNARRVCDVNALEVFRGETLAVVGPSGAGKSTLLRLLAFLEAPDAGEIVFDGERFNGAKTPGIERRRRIAVVFQHPALLNRSVRDNVRYGLKTRGLKNDARVDDTLKLLNIQSLANANAKNVSGGEAQRVALARALVLNPEVLLLDEPTANLDPYHVGVIEAALKEEQRRGATLVLVTHNLAQAKRLAHRVALMLDGKLIEVNETERFFTSTEDARAASFVRGEMIW